MIDDYILYDFSVCLFEKKKKELKSNLLAAEKGNTIKSNQIKW